MITQVKIIGERVSGTCFIDKLVRNNTPLTINPDFGHKHFFQEIENIKKKKTDHILFIYITRDIIEWLQSFIQSTYHASEPIRSCKNFSEFIRHEWSCIYDETFGIKPLNKLYKKEMMNERDPVTKKRFKNVMKLRTSKIQHSLLIEDFVENFVHVRYEDVRDEPELFIETICRMFQIPKNVEFTPIVHVKGRGTIKYVRKTYPEIKEEDLKYIISEMDEDIEKKIGYM